MKAFSQLVRFVALVTALAAPACQAFAIRPLTSLVTRSPLMKRAIYDVPELSISGLSLNSSSSPSFDFGAGTASVAGDLNVLVNFTSSDDAVTYDSIQVQGYYVYGGGSSDNSTQIACGSLTGPININSSQPLQVPISLQISNLSLSNPIVVDISSICLGSQGGELQTVWGGWLGASVANETYRCPLPETNVTIPCPTPALLAPAGEDNGTCSFIPEGPLPPPATESASTSSTLPVAGSTTSSETATTSTVPTSSDASETATTSTVPTSSDASETGTSSADESTSTPTPTDATTTTDISTPTESTVTPTDSTTVSPGVTIATPTPTTTDGTVSQVVPVIVTVTETATAPLRRRRF